MTRNSSQADWKEKYLNVLDEQESRARKQQQFTALLVKALIRISMVAEGIDQQLDQQMAGMRTILQESSASGRDLIAVVDALEGQVKRIDTVKAERAKVISGAFQSIISQLQKLKPEHKAGQQLQSISKNLRARSSRIQEYSGLINEYAKVQQAVLSERNIKRVSKPFWHKWQPEPEAASVEGRAEDAAIEQREFKQGKAKDQQYGPERHAQESFAPGEAGLGVIAEATHEALDLATDKDDIRADIDPNSMGEEPPFSRLNLAICGVLNELLSQLEPPPMALANYHSAKEKIAKGLNWYELVPTLEDISLVIVSAFDNNQKEFEIFLATLDGRLQQAYQIISLSQQASDAEQVASEDLQASMRDQVSAIQQSVQNAVELDQLKNQVSSRLDQIVEAMDRHQRGEKERSNTLSEQFNTLAMQVKTMEAASAEAEMRIEEQRQKALRDVLTQLPNREAYLQRLQQECDRWRRYQRPLVMAVCDIDHFKRINDSYGHLAGDKVLRIIAKTLRLRLRKTDFIARYGGEEFVILMPETEQEQALQVLNGVREAIGSCPFHFKDEPVSITLSFGISGFVTGDQSDQVFARADKALYQAKADGRNQCALAEIAL